MTMDKEEADRYDILQSLIDETKERIEKYGFDYNLKKRLSFLEDLKDGAVFEKREALMRDLDRLGTSVWRIQRDIEDIQSYL